MEDAIRAMNELNNVSIDGQMVSLCYSTKTTPPRVIKSTTLLISHLPREVDVETEEFKNHFTNYADIVFHTKGRLYRLV